MNKRERETTHMDTQLHTAEVKVRLTERDAALLKGFAQHRDVPFSVLARMLLVRSLDDMSGVSRQPPETRRQA